MDIQRAMLILSNQFSKPGSNYDSSSVIINLPPELAQSIVNWSRYRINSANEYVNAAENIYGIQWGPHVTCFYGLHTANPLDVMNVIEQGSIGPFEMTLGPISLFSKPEYDVVKIEIESPGLRMLHTAIGSLPNSNEYPDFKPHLTLAYVKPGWANNLMGDTSFAGLVVKADRVEFSNYNGVRTALPLVGVEL